MADNNAVIAIVVALVCLAVVVVVIARKKRPPAVPADLADNDHSPSLSVRTSSSRNSGAALARQKSTSQTLGTKGARRVNGPLEIQLEDNSQIMEQKYGETMRKSRAQFKRLDESDDDRSWEDDPRRSPIRPTLGMLDTSVVRGPTVTTPPQPMQQLLTSVHSKNASTAANANAVTPGKSAAKHHHHHHHMRNVAQAARLEMSLDNSSDHADDESEDVSTHSDPEKARRLPSDSEEQEQESDFRKKTTPKKPPAAQHVIDLT